MTTQRDDDLTAPPGAPVAVPEWELRDRLARALREVNMSQDEIAHFLGMRRETVSRWMRGMNRPNRPALMAWSTITGVDLGWLETGTPTGQVAGGRWYGIRDLNPEPADMEPTTRSIAARASRDRARLSANRRAARALVSVQDVA